MGKEHEWDDNEKMAWSTWELPSELAGSADDIRHNLKVIEEYVKREGYLVEHGLLDTLVKYSSDPRPRLRFSQPTTHSLGNAIIDALQSRPEPAPPPQPYAGSDLEKLIGTGVDVTDQPLSATEKQQAREQVKADIQAVVEEARKLKKKAEEEYAKSECETMLVVHRNGATIDHGFVNLLRQLFAKREDGSICWVRTREERNKYAEEYEWRKSNGQPTSPNTSLNRF